MTKYLPWLIPIFPEKSCAKTGPGWSRRFISRSTNMPQMLRKYYNYFIYWRYSWKKDLETFICVENREPRPVGRQNQAGLCSRNKWSSY